MFESSTKQPFSCSTKQPFPFPTKQPFLNFVTWSQIYTQMYSGSIKAFEFLKATSFMFHKPTIFDAGHKKIS